MNFSLIKFATRTTYPLLPVLLGERWKKLSTNGIFLVVDTQASDNTILGCTTINLNKIVASTFHQKIKFSTFYGIDADKRDQLEMAHC